MFFKKSIERKELIETAKTAVQEGKASHQRTKELMQEFLDDYKKKQKRGEKGCMTYLRP